MLSSIAKGYKKLFSTIGTVLLLTLCCLILGAIIVFPLWKWATAFPKSYSIAVVCIFALFLIFLIVSKEKKVGLFPFLRKMVKILCLLAGVFLCLFFLYTGRRIGALVTVPLTLLAYGLASFGFQK